MFEKLYLKSWGWGKEDPNSHGGRVIPQVILNEEKDTKVYNSL